VPGKRCMAWQGRCPPLFTHFLAKKNAWAIFIVRRLWDMFGGKKNLIDSIRFYLLKCRILIPILLNNMNREILLHPLPIPLPFALNFVGHWTNF
jgi:hypothetical protein